MKKNQSPKIILGVLIIIQTACMVYITPRQLKSPSQVQTPFSSEKILLEEGQGSLITQEPETPRLSETMPVITMPLVATPVLTLPSDLQPIPTGMILPGTSLVNPQMTLTLEKSLESAGMVTHLRWSGNSHSLLTVQSSGGINIWDVKTANQWPPVIASGGVWSPDGTILALFDQNTITMQNLLNAEKTNTFKVEGEVAFLDWAMDGSKIYLVNSSQGLVEEYEVNPVKKMGEFSTASWGTIRGLELSPDGTYLALIADGVHIYNLLTGSTDYDNLGTQTMGWSPDGKYFATQSATDLTIVKTANWEKMLTIQIPLDNTIGPQTIAWSPDGKCILEARSTEVVIVEAATGKVSQLIPGQTGIVKSIRFSPDGVYLAAGLENNAINLWRIE